MAAVKSPQEILTWRVHPARERPVATAFALIVIAAVTWMSAVIMDNPWWGLLPAAFFLLTLQRFFLPSAYRIDAEGITATSFFSSLSFRWGDVRRFLHDGTGAFLSTRRRPSLFDGFRGMHLVFSGNREQVVERINAELQHGSRGEGPGPWVMNPDSCPESAALDPQSSQGGRA